MRQLWKAQLTDLPGHLRAVLALWVEGMRLALNGCQDTVTLALAHRRRGPAHPHMLRRLQRELLPSPTIQGYPAWVAIGWCWRLPPGWPWPTARAGRKPRRATWPPRRHSLLQQGVTLRRGFCGAGPSSHSSIALPPHPGHSGPQHHAAFPSDPSLQERGLRDGVGSLYVECEKRGELMQSGGAAVDINILLLAAQGWTQRAIANQFGMSRGGVIKVLKRGVDPEPPS